MNILEHIKEKLRYDIKKFLWFSLQNDLLTLKKKKS